MEAAGDDGEQVVEVVRHARGHLTVRPPRLALDQPRLRRAQILDDVLQPLGAQPRLLEQARVLQGVGDVRDERAEELEVHRREGARIDGRGRALGEVDDADDAVLHADGHADEAAAVAPLELADLRDLARDALAQRHFGADRDVDAVAACGHDAQHAALAIEQHDGADTRAYRAHRPLEHEGEQLLHVRHPRRQLDHLVERAELEHEILEPLGGAAQVVEHAREGVADLADLRHAPQARDGGVGRAPGLARPRERAGQPRHAVDHQAEHHEPEHGHREREQHRDFRLERPERARAMEDEDGEQQRQERGQREHDRRRLAEAETQIRAARAIFDAGRGPDDLETAAIVNILGTVREDRGFVREAEGLYKQALSIREKYLDPDHPDIAWSLNNLAMNYRSQRRYGEAEGLLARALKIWERALGPEHPRVATALDNLGTTHRLQGKLTDAEAELRQAARIWERLGHPSQAVSLSHVAALLVDQRRLEEAETVATRAREIAERGLGAAHPATAASLQTLAGVYREQRRFDEAEPLFRRGAAALETSYGGEHMAVAMALDDWALMLRRAGRPNEAALLLERANGIRARAARLNPPG